MIKSHYRLLLEGGLTPAPAAVVAAGLNKRVAIIQNTYLASCPDIFFDEMLWLRILAFCHAYGSGEILVAARGGSREEPLDVFLQRWHNQSPCEKEPAEFVYTKSKAGLSLVVVTEYWAHVGGPPPYSDSYTYVIYSSSDISVQIEDWLVRGRANAEADPRLLTSLSSPLARASLSIVGA